MQYTLDGVEHISATAVVPALSEYSSSSNSQSASVASSPMHLKTSTVSIVPSSREHGN